MLYMCDPYVLYVSFVYYFNICVLILLLYMCAASAVAYVSIRQHTSAYVSMSSYYCYTCVLRPPYAYQRMLTYADVC
jgi:hypothetical protein